jgi:hypothetical protein
MTKQSLPKMATMAELGAILDRSRVIIRGYIARRGLKPDKRGRYAVAPLAEEKIAAAGRAAKPAGEDADGVPRSWSDRKKAKETEKLQIQIDELREDLVPKAEHLADMQEMAQCVMDTFAQWISQVKVLTGDARVVAESERLRDRMLERLRAKVSGETKRRTKA